MSTVKTIWRSKDKILQGAAETDRRPFVRAGTERRHGERASRKKRGTRNKGI